MAHSRKKRSVIDIRGFDKSNAFWSSAVPLGLQHIIYSHMRNLFPNTFNLKGRAIDQNALHVPKPQKHNLNKFDAFSLV